MTNTITPIELTPDDTRQRILDLCRANPEAVNPRGNTSCVYTKLDVDQSGAHQHCLAGQFLKDLGLPVPSNNPPANAAIRDLKEDGYLVGDNLSLVGELLRVAQRTADRPTGRGLLTWGEVGTYLAEEWA